MVTSCRSPELNELLRDGASTVLRLAAPVKPLQVLLRGCTLDGLRTQRCAFDGAALRPRPGRPWSPAAGVATGRSADGISIASSPAGQDWRCGIARTPAASCAGAPRRARRSRWRTEACQRTALLRGPRDADVGQPPLSREPPASPSSMARRWAAVIRARLHGIHTRCSSSETAYRANSYRLTEALGAAFREVIGVTGPSTARIERIESLTMRKRSRFRKDRT